MNKYLKGFGFYFLLFAVIIAVFALTNIPSQETKEIYF